MLCASGCSAPGKTPSARRERSDRRFERCLSTARSAPTATSQGVLAPRERSWCLRHGPGRPAARARTGTPTPHVATKQADVTALRYPSHAAQADAAARATQEGARPALAAPSEPTPSCRDPLRPLPVTLHSLSEALEPCSAGESSISATLKAPHQKLCCSGAEPVVAPPLALSNLRAPDPRTGTRFLHARELINTRTSFYKPVLFPCLRPYHAGPAGAIPRGRIRSSPLPDEPRTIKSTRSSLSGGRARAPEFAPGPHRYAIVSLCSRPEVRGVVSTTAP